VSTPYDLAMTPDAAPARDALVALARTLIDAGESAGVTLRAMGGVGVWLRTAGAVDAALQRDIADVDLAAPRRARRSIEDTFAAAGLEPERELNALNGDRRQVWWTADGSTHVDVFVGEFAMCHRIDLDPGLASRDPALGAAELLLTKLQVVELNYKDAQDAAALLTTHALADGGADADRALSLPRLCDVLTADWGFYTTASDNLERIPEIVGPHAPAVAATLSARCQELRAVLEAAPKSRAFRLRAKVGRRKRWYEIPEESL
jgi:hypothetical protein